MIDQLVIGDLYSYDDYEANMKERKINAPKKKSIKETVPFSNTTYDFSKINGEVYWEERTLEYVFEITADTPEELEEKKQAFVSWIMNVSEEEIHDPFIPDYHFKGTFEEIAFDDEVEKTTMTVKFSAYPYMIANEKKTYNYTLAASEEVAAKIVNYSSHRIVPTFTSDVAFTLKIGSSSYAIPAGVTMDEAVMFANGTTEIILKAAENGTLKIEFNEEVL